MSKIIIKYNAAGECAAFTIPSGRTAAQVAKQSKVTDVNDYEEVADNAFTADEIFFQGGFSVTDGTASWAVAGARTEMKEVISLLYANISKHLVDCCDYPEIVVISQASLSTGRVAEVQTVLDSLNTTAMEEEAVLADVDSADNAAELKIIYDALPADPFPED